MSTKAIPERDLLAAVEPVLREAEHLAIPAIVLGECRHGIWHSHNRQDYQQWLQQYLPHFRILDSEDRTTIACAAVRTELKRAGTTIPSNEVWLAAPCRQHSLPIPRLIL